MPDPQDPDPREAPAEATEMITEHDGHGSECLEWCPICRTADILRAGASPEMRAQWQDIQREALSTLRVVLDHYSRRLDEEAERNASSQNEAPAE